MLVKYSAIFLKHIIKFYSISFPKNVFILLLTSKIIILQKATRWYSTMLDPWESRSSENFRIFSFYQTAWNFLVSLQSYKVFWGIYIFFERLKMVFSRKSLCRARLSWTWQSLDLTHWDRSHRPINEITSYETAYDYLIQIIYKITEKDRTQFNSKISRST